MWKLGAFALIFALILPNIGCAQISEDPNIQIKIVNLSSEGFPVVYSEEAVYAFRYQRIMDQWKVKQSGLWNNLKSDSFIINASAYTAAADECGKSDGVTASGVKVTEKRTLACPAQYPFGAKIEIEGMGVYTCEDRGGAIKGNHFDIYMQTKSDAFAFGRKNLLAKVVLE